MLRKAIFRNSAINALGKAFNYAVQLLLISYLVRSIGGEAYGVFVIALALIGNSNLLEAGFGLSVTKYAAECRARNDAEGLNRVVNTGFLVNTALAAVFSLAILAVSFLFLGFFFKVPAELLPSVRELMLILLALSFFEFWTVGFIRVAEGLQRYALARGMENVKWGFRFAFTAAAFVFRRDLTGLGLAYLAAGIADFAVLAYFIYGPRSAIKFDLRLADRTTFRGMLSFSVWILISKISALFFYRINSIVIGVFLEPVYAAYYSVGSKIYELLRYGFCIISSTLVPVSAELAARDDKRRLGQLFEKSAYYTALLMAPCIAFAAFRSEELVRLWMGAGFAPAAPLARLLIISLAPTLFVASGAEILVGLGQMRQLVVYGAAGSLVSFFISVAFIKTHGINAVAVGAIAGSAVTAAGYLYKMTDYFSFAGAGAGIAARAAGAAVLLAGLCLCLALYGGLAAGLAFTSLYFLSVYFLLLLPAEKSAVDSYLGRFRAKV